MTTKVKICGVTTREDALAAAEYGADAIGFNFSEEAKARNRYVAPADAASIAEALPSFVLSVAVTVNSSLEELHQYLVAFDRVQLHGEEPEDVARALGDRCIKAFRLGPSFQSETIERYPASTVLLDAFVPGARGGTGKTADWERASELVALGKPVWLAGGLTPDNVAEAIQKVRPYGVDTAGGVESAPGKKDHERLRRFINAAKVSVS